MLCSVHKKGFIKYILHFQLRLNFFQLIAVVYFGAFYKWTSYKKRPKFLQAFSLFSFQKLQLKIKRLRVRHSHLQKEKHCIKLRASMNFFCKWGLYGWFRFGEQSRLQIWNTCPKQKMSHKTDPCNFHLLRLHIVVTAAISKPWGWSADENKIIKRKLVSTTQLKPE